MSLKQCKEFIFQLFDATHHSLKIQYNYKTVLKSPISDPKSVILIGIN